MLDQSQQVRDLLDRINEIKIEPLDLSNVNGTCASDIYSLDSNAIPSITLGALNSAVMPSPSYTVGIGTNPVTWTTTGTGTNFNWNNPQPATTIDQGGKMSLRGENADLEINGKSLKTWMEKVEERLNILTTNPELETEWDELRELGERYREIEKRCKEKAETWKKLKAMPPPQVD